MLRPFWFSSIGASLMGCLLLIVIGVKGMQADDSNPAVKPAEKEVAARENTASTKEEAQGRARLLHEAFHALQFVHHEYYRKDEGLALPAATLDRVFRELAARRNVKLRWMAVTAKAMNVDHNPQDDFEKAAVAALTAGQDEFDRVENGVYRHAGTITLTSDCLKCHLPGRTSNRDRAAALVISIPLQTKSKSP
jgi:hypothetical protein